MSNKPKFTQWAGHDRNHWQPTVPTTPKIDPGIYQLGVGFNGPFLKAFDPTHDAAIVVEEGISEKVLGGIKKFVAAKDRYKKFGLLHKRGVLLEGAPGTGKTMSAMIVAKGVVDMGGITAIPEDYTMDYMGDVCTFLKNLRDVQPDVFLNVIWEDIHNYATHRRRMDALLLLLDGYWQIDNVVHIATTNFIENLDARIRNRPGRFDEVYKVLAPNEKSRRSYIEQVIPKDEADPKLLDKLVKVSDGLMLAHLKEMVACVVCQGLPVKEVVDRLQAMNNQSIEAAMLTAAPKGEEEDDE